MLVCVITFGLLLQMFLAQPPLSPSLTSCQDADTTSTSTSFHIRDSQTSFWPPPRPQVGEFFCSSLSWRWLQNYANVAVFFTQNAFSQLPTLLLSMQSMMLERPLSESAGPGLRHLLPVRHLSPYVCSHVIKINNLTYRSIFNMAVCIFMFVPARLPCGLHAIGGRQQYWADPARIRDLSEPGWPSTRSSLQHQHLRCGGGTGEWACFCTGQHGRISSARYTFLNRYHIFQSVKKLKWMKTASENESFSASTLADDTFFVLLKHSLEGKLFFLDHSLSFGCQWKLSRLSLYSQLKIPYRARDL